MMFFTPKKIPLTFCVDFLMRSVSGRGEQGEGWDSEDVEVHVMNVLGRPQGSYPVSLASIYLFLAEIHEFWSKCLTCGEQW